MPDDSLIGQQLDEYRLEALLGQGGMARVYRAVDVRLRRWVAIKVIDTPFRADSDYTMRFEREAQAIAQLEHPHIVHLFRYGEADDLLYMAMQYVEGATLDQVLLTYRRDGEFIEPAEASRLIREVCLALDYAHGQGVIHRDVKPSNIILNKQGHAILTDFGLALLTDIGTRGEIFGTPHYIAPEQAISSAGAVPQSDLYAIGVILYEMFTGVPPFAAPDPLELAMLHMTTPPPPPREIRSEISPQLEAVILKTLAKEPQGRYRDGASLANALEEALKVVTAKSASPLATLSRLSIPERVAVDLAEHPLPPLPAEVVTPPPSPVKPLPISGPQSREALTNSTIGEEVKLEPPSTGRAISTPPASKSSLFYIGAGIGLVMLIGLILVAILLMVFLRLRGNGEALTGLPTEEASPVATAGPAISTEQYSIEIVPIATPIRQEELQAPTATTTPTPAPPTATPLLEPELVADTVLDFSTSQGKWQYLWSRIDANDFKPLAFEERKYGACWYAEDYIRICPASGHPGNSADIAWLWKSDFSGHIRVLLTAHKIDRGGDGVTIVAYHNDQAVEGLQIGGKDTEGVTAKPFFEADIVPGDVLLFVMKRNGGAENDHTAFQAQIYRVP